MCGRATLTAPSDEIAAAFGLDEPPDVEPRFNIAPSQGIAIVRVDPERPGRRLEIVRWGLVPSFAPDARGGHKTINARVESIFARAAFRDAARARRCLVVVDGFYEWQAHGKTKQPFHVRRRDRRPFALAGLWEAWRERPDAAALVTCTVLTGPSQPPIDALHDRMPIVLARERYAAWLDPAITAPEQVRALATNDAAHDLVAVAVSSRVNDPRYDAADCLAPPQAQQLSLLR